MTIDSLPNNLIKRVLTSVVCLQFDRSIDKLEFQSKDLRGAIAGLYPNEILFHQHREDGTVKYSYPLVQYKRVQKRCLLVGIGNAAKLISNLHLVGKTIALPYEKYRILKKDILFQELFYGVTKTIFSYFFLTPWIALNNSNYKKYEGLSSWKGKKELLVRILIGNIISMSKGLGYTVPEPIKVNIGNLREVKTSLKGTPMLGFLGSFSVNFEIPDYFGLGKSVSRGFGTIKRIDSKLNPCQNSRRLNNNPAKIEARGRQE
jgi:hypothetical protein